MIFGVMAAVFALCWLPWYMLALLVNLRVHVKNLDSFMQWFGSLSLLNLYRQPVAVHILQAGFSSGFQRAVWNKLLCKNSSVPHRVWKGILGIRDLAKIRCGIRGNAKYLDGIRDLTATREAGFAKVWARDARFFCLSVGNSGNRLDPSKRSSGKSESTRRVPNINRKGQYTS